jgi:hypothetical protein
MKQVIYNASVLRFRPYRDLGEFVNIGVLVCFPQLNYNYLKINKRVSRITGFFPEIEKDFLKDLFVFLRTRIGEYLHLTNKVNDCHDDLHLDFVASDSLEIFKRLTSHKEGMIVFSEHLSGITEDKQTKINELYDCYVMRNFANHKLNREEMLQETFKKTLNSWKLATLFNPGEIGNDDYKVRIPFFNPKLSIKTLSLNRDVIDIYDTGDKWIAKLSRLSSLGNFNGKLLFPIQYSKDNNIKILNASKDITGALSKFEFVKVLPVIENDKILSYINQNI